MRCLTVAVLICAYPAFVGAYDPSGDPPKGPVLEVSETDDNLPGLLVKVSHRKDDPCPFLKMSLPGGAGGIIPVDASLARFLLSRDGRTLAYGIKNSTKEHQLNAVVMTSSFGLKIYDSINFCVSKQIGATKRGRKILGGEPDLGWAYFTCVTRETISFRAGVWTKTGQNPKHFTCTVRLMPDGSIDVIAWDLETLEDK
jgi:hypothetical protein